MKFTNVKKWLSMLLVVCSMLSLVACGKSDKDPAGDDSEKGTKVAVVFASSGLGDKSFNDALYDGMKKAESTMGIQWVYSEPKDETATSSSAWAAARAPVWKMWPPTIRSRSL